MDVERLRRMADMIRGGYPEKAAELDRALDDVEGGRRDLASIHVDVSYRLEKFDGEWEPGKEPVEVVEGRG
jgi:hypothetical protein